jgi:DNA-binding transcriptional ArsR family regulator
MVEYSSRLDELFGALADPTRRDILKRVAYSELTINEIAGPYDMSLSAVSKHVQVLEEAGLIAKRKKGRRHLVRLVPEAVREAAGYLDRYRNEELDILIDVRP